MGKTIAVRITGKGPGTDAPSVGDLLDQLRDYFDLLEILEETLAEDGQSAIVWRIVDATKVNPLTFTIQAFARQYAVNVDARADHVVDRALSPYVRLERTPGEDTAEKVDSDLATVLRESEPEDVVRIVAVIRPSASAAAPPTDESLERSQSRRAFREALIRSQAGVRAANAQVLQHVRELGLEPRGGEQTGVFFVEATKEDVERLVALDDIASLSLDKEIQLERPSK